MCIAKKRKVNMFTLLILVRSGYATTIGECRPDNYSTGGRKCANYYYQRGSCLECSVGHYGMNCSNKCTPGWYGKACGDRCQCNVSECDYRTGCPTYSSVIPSSVITTIPSTTSSTSIAKDPSDTKEDTTFQPKNGVVLGSAGVVSLLIIILIVYILLKMRVHRQEQEEQANVSTDNGRYDEINEVNLNNVPNEEIEIENARRRYEFVHKYQNVDNFIYSKMETDNTKYHEIVDLIETDESMISENRYSHDMLVNENNVYEEPMVNTDKHMYINVIELESRNCSEDIEQALNREANISEKPHYESHFFIEDLERSLHNTDIDRNNITQQDISSSCPPKDGTHLDVVF